MQDLLKKKKPKIKKEKTEKVRKEPGPIRRTIRKPIQVFSNWFEKRPIWSMITISLVLNLLIEMMNRHSVIPTSSLQP